MRFICFFFFFFNDTATTEIYTLSLHDALPISVQRLVPVLVRRAPHHHSVLLERQGELRMKRPGDLALRALHRSEEHTSELQSRLHLVCRLLLEKKNTH